MQLTTMWQIASWSKFVIDNQVLSLVILAAAIGVIRQLASCAAQTHHKKHEHKNADLSGIAMNADFALLDETVTRAKTQNLQCKLWGSIAKFTAFVLCGLFILWFGSHGWSVYCQHLTLREHQFKNAMDELDSVCISPSELRVAHCNQMYKIVAQSPESWAVSETASHMLGDITKPTNGLCGSYCRKVLLSSIETLVGSVFWVALMITTVLLAYFYVFWNGPVAAVSQLRRFKRDSAHQQRDRIQAAAQFASPVEMLRQRTRRTPVAMNQSTNDQTAYGRTENEGDAIEISDDEIYNS